MMTIISLNIVLKVHPGVRISLLRLNNIPLYGHTTFYVSAHPLRDIWIAYTVLLLWLTQQWTLVDKSVSLDSNDMPSLWGQRPSSPLGIVVSWTEQWLLPSKHLQTHPVGPSQIFSLLRNLASSGQATVPRIYMPRRKQVLNTERLHFNYLVKIQNRASLLCAWVSGKMYWLPSTAVPNC